MGVAFLGVFLISLWPASLWRWQGLALLVLGAVSFLAGFRWRPLFRRLGVVWLFAGFMSLGLLGQPGWALRTGNLFVKATLSLWTLSLLIQRASIPELVAGLRFMRVPRIWTDAFSFWSRYYYVLGEEWRRLQMARAARTLQRDRRREFRALAHGLGLLFIRAYERAEQVHRAMLARGCRDEL